MKTFLKKHLLIIEIAGTALFLLFSLYLGNNLYKKFISLNSIQSDSIFPVTDTAVPSMQEPAKIALPIRLKIPSINVDATIEQVGLTPKGAMDVPKDRNNVAWFDPGTHPGQKGSAVMAGHLDWTDGQKAVFENLDTLKKGDLVVVETDNGKSVSFKVRESHIYDREVDTTDIFSSSDGSHLNLITCVGTWDKSQKSYTKRLVVFTDLAS